MCPVEASDQVPLANESETPDIAVDDSDTPVVTPATPAGTVAEDGNASDDHETSTDSDTEVSPPSLHTKTEAASNQRDSFAPEESLRSLVGETTSQSPWEISHLILERIRFGKLVEELRPGASDLVVDELHEDDEAAVGVGAASPVSRQVTSNAMRSREAAVRELDELVLAASNSANASSTASVPAAAPNSPSGESTNGADVSNSNSADPDRPDDSEYNECQNSIDVHTVENKTTQTDETHCEPVLADVEQDEEAVADDAAVAATDDSLDGGNPISLLDRLKHSVAEELDTVVESESDSIADVDGASTESGTVDPPFEKPWSGPGSLLSMFDVKVDESIEPNAVESDAGDPDAGDQQLTPVEDSPESDDTRADAEPEDGDNLRTQLADMFDLPEVRDHAEELSNVEEPSRRTPLDERISSLSVDHDDDADIEFTDLAEEPTLTESVTETSSDDNQISSYMHQLLARNRVQTGVPEGEVTAPVREHAGGEVTEPDTVSEDDDDRSWLQEGPLHKQDREQVMADTQAFRELANQSARSAVDESTRKQLRTAVMAKTVASVSALLVAAVCLSMDLSKIFGFSVLAIGLVFTVDLFITIARNWSAVARLARSRRADGPPGGNAADETAADEVNPDAPLTCGDEANPDVDLNVSDDRLARAVQAETKPVRNVVPDPPTAEFESRVRELFGESAPDGTDEKPRDWEVE